MKKVLVSMLSISLLVFAVTGVSYGWQGKMAGMGDPYGLVQDESDFLIHPALIATGEGVRFYGDLRFTYTDVTDWDYNLDEFNTAGTLKDYYHFDTSGDEQKHEALLGTTLPLGAGRMGVFVSYDGMRGNYDGDADFTGTSNAAHDLTKELDNFALRLLYGLPLGGVNLGGEVQFAYRQEENGILQYTPSISLLNFPQGAYDRGGNLFPFMIPYDSSYGVALLKGSLEGKIGTADVECTLRGGFIFGGDNRYRHDVKELVSTLTGNYDLDGGVDGRSMGGDLWVRYPLGGGLSLPFLVRADYREKTKDGNGTGRGGYAGELFRYENQEKKLQMEAGGGVDREFDTGTRIAVGIYYRYLQDSEDFWILRDTTLFDYSDYPSSTEHQALVRFTGEREFSPAVELRTGLSFFYGWVREDFVFAGAFDDDTHDIDLNGYRWGVVASAGGTVIFDSFTLEPFLNIGYQHLGLDGDGTRTGDFGATKRLSKMDKSRSEWYIGGGFSVLFDL